MKPIFRSASFFFLFTIFFILPAFAQQPPHLVLFETFSGEASPCNLQDQLDFQSAVKTTVNQDESKVVHLNYFLGNEPRTPYNLDVYGGFVDALLSGGAGNAIYTSAVDRKVFGSTGARIDPNSSGGSTDDWGSVIEMDAAQPAEAYVTLNFATIDKTNSQSYNLHADMTVTANQVISDSLIIRYAITQDNVAFRDSCAAGQGAADLENDMVWEVTTGNTSNYVVCTPAHQLNAGDAVHVTWDFAIDVSDPLYQNAANMKLVAFLEDEGIGDGNSYFVANAAILKMDLDTLQAPAPTLTLIENNLTDSTLHPGTTKQIQYTSSNLPTFADAYYSLDNGTTWRLIASGQRSPISWLVPDSLTTTGKIQLIAHGYPSIISTEKGTFTIAYAPYATILSPKPAQVLQGGSLDTIVWTNLAVTGNTLQYYLAASNGGFVTPHVLGHMGSTDTSYVWTVPDTNKVVEIQLVPDSDEAPAYSVVDTIKTLTQGVASGSTPQTGLAITNIFPNPAENGQEIIVQYAQAQPKPIMVQLLDVLGRQVPKSYTIGDQQIQLTTSALAASVYVIRLSDGTNTVSKRLEVLR